MNLRGDLLILTVLLCLGGAASAQTVIEDDGVGLSKEELEHLVKYWTPDMQRAAANDPGDRIELVNIALANKKIAALADTITREDNPEDYWKYVLSVRNIQRRFVVQNYMSTLEVPDMTELARERYKTEKDKYALVPEQRYSSHILLMCAAGECDRDARRIEAQAILAELEAGADFRELAGKYSEDPGSNTKGGRFDRLLRLGEAGVDPNYVGEVFEIDAVGQHSGVVDSRFGLHIIRLDDLQEAYYKPYEEVRTQITDDLRAQYSELAAKKFDAGFRLSDKAYIDSDAMQEIFAQYRTRDVSERPEKGQQAQEE